MTYCKHICLALLLALCPAMSRAQIINDWGTGTTLPGHDENGIVTTVADGKNASTSQFLDWEHTLGDFADIKTISEQELKARMAKEARRREDLLSGIPSIIDENGIDLYMLTQEGIEHYMKLLNPVFYQKPSQDVVKWIRYYAYNKRANTKKIFERYERWEPHIHNCFDFYGVPRDIAILCIIESACTYNALSKAGALGMWQIMPTTGRQFGLKVDEKNDERKDPVKATAAAAKILKYNYEKSGDWTEAVAGYNCGIGRVTAASTKAASREWEDIKPRLPKETQQYIPSLLAIYYVWRYREKLNL